jgi:hypothetical protein
MSANVPAKNAPAAAPAANAGKKNNAPAANANKKNNAATANTTKKNNAPAANANKKNNSPANAGKKNNAPANANAANAANAANENAANAPIPRHASVEKIEVSAKGLKELVDKDAKCAELKEQAKKVINDSSAVDEALKKDEVKEPNLKSITNLLKGTIDPIANACKTNATAAEMKGGRRKQKTQKRKAKKSRSKSRRRI